MVKHDETAKVYTVMKHALILGDVKEMNSYDMQRTSDNGDALTPHENQPSISPFLVTTFWFVKGRS